METPENAPKRRKNTEQVRASESRFKESGGKILPIRLQTEDQSILHQIGLLEPNETNTGLIRKALRSYRDSHTQPVEQPKIPKGNHMKIIAVVNGKGGSGKSTLVMGMSDALASRGFKVIIIDADRQVTLKNWMERRKETNPDLPCPSLYAASSHISRAGLLSDFGHADFVFLDAPGGRIDELDTITSSCIAASDVALIPMNTSYLDLDQTRHTINMLKARQALTDGMPVCRAIISRAVPSKVTYRDTLAFIQSHDLIKLSRDMTQRTLLESIPSSGLSSVYSGDKKMVTEINEIVDEVLALFAE